MATLLTRGLLLAFQDGTEGYLLQYPRVVMVKVLLAGAVFCLLKGQNEDLSCHLHEDNEYKDIIQKACWNFGVYVYDELRNSLVYGVPKDLAINGMKNNKTLCRTFTPGGMLDQECKEMTKVYFKQYQFIHYVLLLCALLYWFPHSLFRCIEDDVERLKHLLETLPRKPNTPSIDPAQGLPPSMNHQVGKDDINAYLNKLHEMHTVLYKRRLNEAVKDTIDRFFIDQEPHLKSYLVLTFHRLREPIKIVFRLSYAALSLIPLCLINSIYNGHFLFYGFNWINSYLHSWLDSSNMNYLETGNTFLPLLGFCDIRAVVGKDVERLHFTKLICEITKHSDLQYVFLIIWMFIVLGLILSPLDFLLDVLELWRRHQTYTHVCKDFNSHNLNLELNMRQVRYFVMIREANPELLNDIVVKLSLNYRQRARCERGPYAEVREKPLRDSLDTALLRRKTLKSIEEIEVGVGQGVDEYRNTLL